MARATIAQAGEEPDTRVIKRRKRVPVSCEPCRPRKLKCDRQRPCQNCIARETPSSCWYAKQGANEVRTAVRSTDSDDVRSRINRLESLVISLMPDHSHINVTTGSAETLERSDELELNAMHSRLNVRDISRSEPSQRVFGLNKEKISYVGESKWDAMLRDIAIVKEYLTEDLSSQQILSDDIECESPAIFMHVLRTQSEAELLSLPSRTVMDQLVARFFEAYDPAIPVIHMLHKPTFLQQFEHYRSKLSDAPMIWLGLLYSMFCLALQSYVRNDDEPTNFQGISADVSDVYRKRAAQCILIDGLSTTSSYSLEALLLYAISEYSRLPDGNSGVWMVMGLLVRKAMHMGLHRDPTWFPGVPPFESEARRRLWISISQMDLLLSFQLGLPSMIRCPESDVKPPRNVYEEEIYEGMTELPPSRPPNEPTLISYIIAKQRIFQVFGQVVDYINCTTGYSYHRVIELNTALSDAKAQIPPHLQVQPFEQSIVGPRELFLQRLQLQMFYDKAICVLNRRFLIQPETCKVHKQAQQSCIQAALSLLSIQSRMQHEEIKWYHFSLTNHDFLLAAVIISLILYIFSEVRRIKGPGFNTSAAFECNDKDLLQALNTTQRIWSNVPVGSVDAHKALRMIDFMLEKIEALKFAGLSISTSPNGRVNQTTNTLKFNISEPQQSFRIDPAPVDFDSNATFDWDLWDSMVRGGDFDKLNDLWQTQPNL